MKYDDVDHLEIARMHVVPVKYQDEFCSELAFFLHANIDATKLPTPEDILRWLKTHQDYAVANGCKLGYTSA